MTGTPSEPPHFRRRGFLLAAGGAVAGTLAATYLPAASAEASPLTTGEPGPAGPGLAVGTLRTDYLDNPVGIDDPAPGLSWRLSSAGRNQAQSAYQVLVASSPKLLSEGRADLWDSGKVVSRESVAVPYGGRTLRSREQLWWQVRVWDERGRPSAWSTPAHVEMGLLEPADWNATWIGDSRHLQGQVLPLTITFAAQQARIVRLNITRLGAALQASPADYFVQLAEMQVLSGGQLVSAGATPQASESLEISGLWGLAYINDGKLTSVGSPSGWTSDGDPQPDLGDGSVWVELDLGQDVSVDEVRLYPRTDSPAVDGGIASFPVDFSILTQADGSTDWTTAYTVTSQQPPQQAQEPATPVPLPLLARGFTLGKPVAKARLYATGMGVYEARLNGKKVGDAMLEPANTVYGRRARYTTYDVTSALRRGQNTLGFMLGNGIYNVPATPGRNNLFTDAYGTTAPAPLKVIAQLEVFYADGSADVIVTDENWRTQLGPVTFSGWYGGEDYDARLEVAGWDEPGADYTGWQPAVTVDPLEPGLMLSAQAAPPIRVQQKLTAISREQVADGVWLYDFGRNFSGLPQVTVRGAAGAQVHLVPGERLTSGRVDRSGVSWNPFYFQFVPASDDEVTWHPRFSYDGFRWIEVSGLQAPPDLRDVQALVLRADNELAGSFTTSEPLLNTIHTITVRAIESNMYSVLTDCPTREKLGWNEEVHLVFDAVAANFDVAAYYPQLIQNMIDSQSPQGEVPWLTPPYVPAGDDPNWSAAMIRAPWKLYQAYGDIRALRTTYPAMQLYMDYLATQAQGYILNYGLGDWQAPDSTPVNLVVTTAYYRDATTMSQVAEALGDTAGKASYDALAGQILAAFNTQFFNSAAQSYGPGTQAANALPLAAGMVPGQAQQAVLANILANIHARGNHLSTGEIGLRGLLDSLGDAGQADTVLTLASNPTTPSYADMIARGATTLWEFWDGSGGSLNHWMLGGIDDWMYRYLAGIQVTAPGFERFTIAPLVPDGLARVQASWPTPYGPVGSAWQRDSAAFHLQVDVPVSTTAAVCVPLLGGTPSATPAVKPLQVAGGRAVYEVGSGRWSFQSVTGKHS